MGYYLSDTSGNETTVDYVNVQNAIQGLGDISGAFDGILVMYMEHPALPKGYYMWTAGDETQMDEHREGKPFLVGFIGDTLIEAYNGLVRRTNDLLAQVAAQDEVAIALFTKECTLAIKGNVKSRERIEKIYAPAFGLNGYDDALVFVSKRAIKSMLGMMAVDGDLNF